MAQRFYPDISSELACKCGACRRNCCSDWEVLLTKQEFRANMSKALGPGCHALAQKHFQRNPDAQGDDDYALCTLTPNGACSLLTPDGLCAWKKIGPEGPCATCSDFPNTYISFLEDEYVFPSVSCEAVVELLLHKTDPLRLINESVSRPKNRHNARIEQKNFSGRPLLELYPALIQWGMTILHERRFSIDDRMVLLAHAMYRIDWMERKSRIDEISGTMEKFLEMENLQQILHQYDKYSIGPKALLTVNANVFARFVSLPPYQENARRALHGLGIEFVETAVDGRIECRLKLEDSGKYSKRKELLAGFMRRNEVLLEHVLVCEYLRSMMPVTEPGVWDNFIFFNVCHTLLKGILIGTLNDTPREAEIVDAIVMVHRMVIHDYQEYDRTLENLRQIQLTDLMSMVALAKG